MVESALKTWSDGEGLRISNFKERLRALSAGEITVEGLLKGLEGGGQFRTFVPEADKTTPWQYIIERKKGNDNTLLVSSRQVGMEIPQITARVGLNESGVLEVIGVTARCLNHERATFRSVTGYKRSGKGLLQEFMGGFKAA